jgi:predicted acyl esterase
VGSRIAARRVTNPLVFSVDERSQMDDTTSESQPWLRVSHQEVDPKRSTEEIPFYTHEKMTHLTPGKIYKIEIPLQPIAYRFRKGNRIRLEIANGDSPVTDNLFFHFYRPDKIGADTIYHGVEHPSELLLPVLTVD